MARKVLVASLILVLILIAGSLVGISLLFHSQRSQGAEDAGAAAENTARAASSSPEADLRQYDVKLYFMAPDKSSGLLVTEKRKLFSAPDKPSLVRNLIGALEKGSETGNLPILPKGAYLRQLFILDSLVVLDFSSELATHHPGGVLRELATVQGVANTVTSNVPGVARVRILVDGAERETLAGHISLEDDIGWSQSVVAGYN